MDAKIERINVLIAKHEKSCQRTNILIHTLFILGGASLGIFFVSTYLLGGNCG